MDLPASPDPLAAARALGPAVDAAADAIEASRSIPPDLAAALHAARLSRMLLPRSVGGDEVHPAAYLLAIQELARHDASLGWCTFVANSAALIAAHLGPAEAAAIFGPPDSLVAWGPPNGTVAEAVPGGYRVSGQFAFASGSRLATWMGVHCPVREADGSLRRNQHGRPAIRTLLFPAARAELLGDWDAIGLRGTASEGYRVEALFVPEAFSATREMPEARREKGPLYAFTQQGLYGVGAAGVALGIARAMLDGFAALARGKTPRGQALMATDPLVQDGFGRAEAGLSAARAWLLEILREMVAAAPAEGAFGIPDRARLRLGCIQAMQAAVAAADWAHHAAGVDAIRPGSPLERRFRDMHTVSQQIQARRAHFAAAARILLGEATQDFL